jgi:aquaporin Z
MTFAGAHVPGAHYNSAVTLTVLLRGRMSIAEAIPYMIVQVIGAFAAAGMVMLLSADKIPSAPTAIANTSYALIADLLGAFALAYVY